MTKHITFVSSSKAEAFYACPCFFLYSRGLLYVFVSYMKKSSSKIKTNIAQETTGLTDIIKGEEG